MSGPAGAASEFFRAVEAYDVHKASDLVISLLDEGLPMGQIITDVLAPAQVRAGELWRSGRWSVADEHAATSITEGALAALTYAATPRRGSHTRHVAVACVEGEWHSLPARMAAAIAGASGEVRVTMLGPSIPVEHLHSRLSQGDIDVLALSCSLPTNLVGAARCIAAAHDLGTPVIVGGRGFGGSAHRAQAIGADRWTADPTVLSGATPGLVGRDRDVAGEVLCLDAVDEAVLDEAYDRIAAVFPSMSSMTSFQHARTREDLGWIVRHTASALLTDDATIVEDLLTWLCQLLQGSVPAAVITGSARVLAGVLEQRTPAGAAILRQATETVEIRSGHR